MTTNNKLAFLMQKHIFEKLSPALKLAVQNYQSAVIGHQELTSNAIDTIKKLYNLVKNG